VSRFSERAKVRDPLLEQELFELFTKDAKENSVAQFVLDAENFKAKALDDTRIFREYIVKESLNQYRDYYETDSEE
jgi:hypothetical protein